MLDGFARWRDPILGPGIRFGEDLFCLRERIVTTGFLLVCGEASSAALYSLVVGFSRHNATISVSLRGRRRGE